MLDDTSRTRGFATPDQASPDGAFPGVPIAEVSHQLGVPMPTLRSWSLRHGIPRTTMPWGSTAGTRRQSHTLRLMRDEIARGKRASLAAEAVLRLLGSPARPPVHPGHPGRLQRGAGRCPRHLSARCSTSVWVRAWTTSCCPPMQQVGLWWQTGRCTVEDEHLTTEAARAWLEDLSSSAPAPSRPGPIVPGLWTNRSAHHRPRGAVRPARDTRVGLPTPRWRTSVPALGHGLHATAASAVVIVSHLNSGRARAVQSCGRPTLAGVRSSTPGTRSVLPAAGATSRGDSWAPVCRRPASSSRPSSPELSAFDIGQAAEDAVVQSRLQCPREARVPDLAPSAHPPRLLRLGQRRLGLPDREEQVGILVQARRAMTPIHLQPLLVGYDGSVVPLLEATR